MINFEIENEENEEIKEIDHIYQTNDVLIEDEKL